MFNVICIETGTVVAEGIATGAEAAALAAAHTETSGKRHQPRRMAAPNAIDWRERERGRFADGTYTTVPWAQASWIKPALADHFAHVSTKKPGLVAYTPDAEKGLADRQVPMKPGAYLAEHYGDVLTTGQIKDLANQFIAQHAPCELKLAETADEIEHVYTHGPSSCMSHDASHYASPIHPVRVYAAGDVAVAYVTDNEDDEAISARCLCRPAKKLYSRIYGDETRLGVALQRAGYSFSDNALVGARLQRVPCDHGGFVAPYVDYCCTANDDSDYLVIARHGDLDCGRTDGLTDPACTCDHCGEGMDEEDSYGVGDERWCGSCYETDATYCEHCETTAQMDVSEVYLITHRNRRRYSEMWCDECVSSDAFTCEGSGRVWHEDQRVELENGTVWSQEYFEDNGSTCDGCNGSFSGDDVTEHTTAGMFCSDCMPDEEAEEDEEDAAEDEQPCAECHGLLAVGDVVNVRWPADYNPCSSGPYAIMELDDRDEQYPYRVIVHVNGLPSGRWARRDWIVPDDAPAERPDQTQPGLLAVGATVHVRWPAVYGLSRGSYTIVETDEQAEYWPYQVDIRDGCPMWVRRDWIIPPDAPADSPDQTVLAIGDMVNVRWPAGYDRSPGSLYTIVAMDEPYLVISLGVDRWVVHRDWIVPDAAPVAELETV